MSEPQRIGEILPGLFEDIGRRMDCCEVIISKNRRGPVGKAGLVFVHDYTKFSDMPVGFVGAAS